MRSPARPGCLPGSVGWSPSPSRSGPPRTDSAPPSTRPERGAGERPRRAGRRGGARARTPGEGDPCRERAVCPDDDGYRSRRFPRAAAFRSDPGRARPRSGLPPRGGSPPGRPAWPGSGGHRRRSRPVALGQGPGSRCPRERPAAEVRWPDPRAKRPRGGLRPPGGARRRTLPTGTGRASRPPRTARSGSAGHRGEAARVAGASGGYARAGAGRRVRRPG